MRGRILIVEDDDARIMWFKMATIGHVVDITKDPNSAIQLLETHEYTHIFLDHDLSLEMQMACINGEPVGRYDDVSGYKVARYLSENKCRSESAEIVVHSYNPEGSQRMIQALRAGGRHCERIPFDQLKKVTRHLSV